MIQSPLLKHFGGYVAGQWITTAAGGTFDVHNPATGERLAALPCLAEAETAQAIAAAETALRQPAAPEQRKAWLQSISDQLLEHKHEFGRIITLENGKPLKESVVEVEYTAGFLRFFAEQIHRVTSESVSLAGAASPWTIHHRPAGVAGLITPWNLPLAMIGKKVAPALAAGCAVVVKPAEQAPLSTLALTHAAERAGVPAGQLNLVVGPPEPIGDVLCRHPAVRVISFTGSTSVGRKLVAKTAPHVKRLALELGGSSPFIVFDDADLEAAVAALLANKFRAAGQTCICTNRVYVHQRVADSYTAMVADQVAKLRVGNGLDPQTDIGPLINRDGFDKVSAHVRDAISRGARRIVGQDPPRPANDWGAFYPPTVLTGVTSEMLVCREETFGPVVAMATFDEEESLVRAANSTPYGLAAYLFTKDPARAERVIARLNFGHVGWNTGAGPRPEMPFGGMKQSGYGREGGLEGLLEFCETQIVARS